MGIDPKVLNDRQIGMIGDPKQRRVVTKARGFKTQAEVSEKADRDAELDMHDKYISFLRRNELPFVRANPVRKSTIKKGAPDFTVTAGKKYGYRSMYLEFKRPCGVLSEAQVGYFNYLRECGCWVVVAYSYTEAIQKTAEFFGFAWRQE